MKKFKGNRSLKEILQNAKENGWDVDTTEFDKNGSDWIWIRDIRNRMLQIKFNTTNGNFFIWNPSSEKPVATHLSTELDNEDWYAEILNLFYLPHLASETGMKRLEATVIILGNYGVVTPSQRINFDDKCPICGENGLEIKNNRYCSDGVFYWTDNIYCKNKCNFKYDDLVNLTRFKR